MRRSWSRTAVDVGIEALMLITANPQLTLWETILPPGYQDLPRQLAAVDAVLDDPGVLRALPGALLPDLGSPVDPDRDLPADDVPQADLWTPKMIDGSRSPRWLAAVGRSSQRPHHWRALGGGWPGWSGLGGERPEPGQDFGEQAALGGQSQGELAGVADEPASGADQPVPQGGDHCLAVADTRDRPGRHRRLRSRSACPARQLQQQLTTVVPSVRCLIGQIAASNASTRHFRHLTCRSTRSYLRNRVRTTRSVAVIAAHHCDHALDAR